MDPEKASVITVSPELRSLLRRAREWDANATAVLERLGEQAEESCNYAVRDERSADYGEAAWELLGALLAALDDIR